MTVKTFLPVPPSLRNQPKNRALIIQERRLAALKLRKQGLSIARIAAKLGVTAKTLGLDLKYCLKELVELTAIETDEYRQLEVERLDKMIEVCMVQIEAGGNGALWAIDRAITIADRRAKFLGLDKPMALIVAGDKDNPLEIQHKHSIDDELMARMNRLAGVEDSNTAQLTNDNEVIDVKVKELPAP